MPSVKSTAAQQPSGSRVVVLGVAQDAGHPQLGCQRSCCAGIWEQPERHHLPAGLGIITKEGHRWMVEASPALPQQLHRLDGHCMRGENAPLLDGMLLTHAHMGHLVGLAYLGTEAAAVRDLPVYLPAGLANRLRDAVPWSALITEGRIRLHPLRDGDRFSIGADVTVEVLEVPHRREWSETLAFIIQGPGRRVLFLPDIDAWEGWSHDLQQLITDVDVAWIDGTFYADGELSRDMSAIPHPRVVHTMALLADAPQSVRSRVHFTHLNHTNPLLDLDSPQAKHVRSAGFHIAQEGEVVAL